MSSTIQETVQTALTSQGRGDYMTYARPVIERLTERERSISEQLLTYASDLGADSNEVRSYLAEIGMTVPAAEPDEDDDDDELANDPQIQSQLRSLSDITRRLDSLTEFARRNGYSG